MRIAAIASILIAALVVNVDTAAAQNNYNNWRLEDVWLDK